MRKILMVMSMMTLTACVSGQYRNIDPAEVRNAIPISIRT